MGPDEPIDRTRVLRQVRGQIGGRWSAAVESPRFALVSTSILDLRPAGPRTIMLEQGVDLLAVSRVLGQADVGTTANIYGHLTQAIQQSAARPDGRRAGAHVLEPVGVRVGVSVQSQRPSDIASGAV
jgi:integrase